MSLVVSMGPLPEEPPRQTQVQVRDFLQGGSVKPMANPSTLGSASVVFMNPQKISDSLALHSMGSRQKSIGVLVSQKFMHSWATCYSKTIQVPLLQLH